MLRRAFSPRSINATHACLFAVLLLGTACALFAQVPAVPSYRSPEVLADGRVTLRFYAPNAQQVAVTSDALPSRLSLQRDEQGLWSITIGPLTPDYYSYAFEVDGLSLLDPKNTAIHPSLDHPSSVLHVVGNPLQLWEVEDVPHGVVHHHFYKSAAVGDERDFYVYTPPGYEKGRLRYPVLYLLHGFTDDAGGWLNIGRANVILDNLIAQGKARPMIVVMPLGYGQPELLQVGLESPYTHKTWMENLVLFKQTLLNEVIPQVEAEYRISKKREDHAITGLSMGGVESLYVGIFAPERFAWIGGFSSAVQHFELPQDFPLPPPSKAPQFRLLWIACGTDDRRLGANQNFIHYLQSGGFHPVAVETAGDHTWLVWRRNLIAFAPLLFQK